VNEPELVFLDEPTNGLDPQARHKLWDVIYKMKEMKKTVVLTTHYMEEAEKLCDRVAIIDHGKIIAEGKPSDLIKSLNLSNCVTFSTESAIDQKMLGKLKGVQKVFSEDSKFKIHTSDLQDTLTAFLSVVEKNKFSIEQLNVTRPTLEDVFLEMTGRSLRD
jgi:ABC-2 type transport system ATP-binding protein